MLDLAIKVILNGWPQTKLRELLPDRLALAHTDLLLTYGTLRSLTLRSHDSSPSSPN